MWPWVLGSAALGGLQAYQKSGGDIGKTLTGAAIGGGLGGLASGVPRMAGALLGGELTAGIAPAVYRAGQRLGSPLDAAKTLLSGKKLAPITSPMITQQLGGQEILSKAGAGLAGLGLTAAIPAVAAGLSGAGPAAVKGVGQLAGGAAAMGVGQQTPSGAFVSPGGAIPGQLPVQASPYTPMDVYNPMGSIAASRSAGLKEGDVQLENARKIMPYLFQAAEARSKAEFERQLAAAGVRQNIATSANMLERSQQAAQQMGLNAASQMGAALTSQYQYS